jgi:hypothetical protein
VCGSLNGDGALLQTTVRVWFTVWLARSLWLNQGSGFLFGLFGDSGVECTCAVDACASQRTIAALARSGNNVKEAVLYTLASLINVNLILSAMFGLLRVIPEIVMWDSNACIYYKICLLGDERKELI